MIRGTLRPLPKSEALRGLRINGFYDHDAYVKNADRTRGIFGLTYEHKYVNASWEYLTASDQNASATKTKVDANGYSFWIIPRSPKGWEGLLRYDHLEPNQDVSGTRTRWIGGVAYWFPHQGNVSTSLMFDVDQANFDNFATATANRHEIRAPRAGELLSHGRTRRHSDTRSAGASGRASADSAGGEAPAK